ncbi:glycosyltransferase [Pedobacter immunditicola]|uniref:glycosyltransferase n=1 Tax=Pedobacter immunditicola TaxID=3133440 RepID=UPI0030A39822
MKILHYIDGLVSGGAEKLVTDILPLMKEEGHEVQLLISNKKNLVTAYHNLLRENGISVKTLDSSNYNPLQVYQLIRLLRNERYDIVHAHLFPSQYWLAVASWFKPSRTRLVKTEHSVHNNRRKYQSLQRLEKVVYNRYAMTISITTKVDKSLQSWLEKVRSVVIPNGVNLNQLEKERAQSKDIQYDIFKEGNYNILMVGRFSEEKDQQTLIQSMQYLPEHFHLFFAGSGTMLEPAKQFAKSLDLTPRVHFLGMRTDVYSLMNKVDLNVLSTNFEGLSGVTLESLASEKPFIGSDVPGVNDIVPDPRLLFPPRQPEILAKKIKETSQDHELYAEMVKLSLEHVKKYCIIQMCNRYLKVYEGVLGKNGEVGTVLKMPERIKHEERIAI